MNNTKAMVDAAWKFSREYYKIKQGISYEPPSAAYFVGLYDAMNAKSEIGARDHVVMCGDPINGFKFVGPFTRDEAKAEFVRLDKIVGKVGMSTVWYTPLVPIVAWQDAIK